PRSAGYRVLRPLWQPLLDRHAALIAVSQPVVDAMSRYFHARWEIIPNGVDVQFFQPNGRRPTEALARGPRLLFLARLEPRNGLGTLLEAMPRILERHPLARLTVVGDGPWRGYYERRARRLGDAVRFAGRVLAGRRGSRSRPAPPWPARSPTACTSPTPRCSAGRSGVGPATAVAATSRSTTGPTRARRSRFSTHCPRTTCPRRSSSWASTCAAIPPWRAASPSEA